MSRYEEDTKIIEELNKFKVKCKHCGHSVVLVKMDRAICSWCKNYVYKTPAIEFRYKITNELRRVENDRK